MEKWALQVTTVQTVVTEEPNESNTGEEAVATITTTIEEVLVVTAPTSEDTLLPGKPEEEAGHPIPEKPEKEATDEGKPEVVTKDKSLEEAKVTNKEEKTDEATQPQTPIEEKKPTPVPGTAPETAPKAEVEKDKIDAEEKKPVEPEGKVGSEVPAPAPVEKAE